MCCFFYNDSVLCSKICEQNSYRGPGCCRCGGVDVITALTPFLYVAPHRKGNHSHSQVCSARKLMALLAVLKRKETIEPIRPGISEAVFLPPSFRPLCHPFAEGFQGVGNCANDGPNRDASRKEDRCHCYAVFFEDLFNFFPQRHPFFEPLSLVYKSSSPFGPFLNVLTSSFSNRRILIFVFCKISVLFVYSISSSFCFINCDFPGPNFFMAFFGNAGFGVSPSLMKSRVRPLLEPTY